LNLTGIIEVIEIAEGNLLNSPVEALVNTVNTEGVMGKGIALQFKQAYPQMFRVYAKACKAGEVQLGKMDVHDLGGIIEGPRWIINFPTKGHWRSRSRKSDIDAGLQDLIGTIQRLNIRSIAVPPLGCGHGGLNWADVRPLIESTLGRLPDVHVLVFPPGATPAAATMPNRTERPKMTIGQAALIALMDRYLQGLLDPFVSLLEIHKLMYFLQAAGQPLRLQFEPREFGPYAKNLRQVLIRLESHYIHGYGDGNDSPAKPIELIDGVVDEAQAFLRENDLIRQRMDRVAALIEGYEDPYGLELLSSVHWVMVHNPEATRSAADAARAVHQWNSRKRRTLKIEHLSKAWHRLVDSGWAPTEPTANRFE
jgi:O-acetyl-ADP-ribose deacetylase (regulator of RNase III)